MASFGASPQLLDPLKDLACSIVRSSARISSEAVCSTSFVDQLLVAVEPESIAPGPLIPLGTQKLLLRARPSQL